MRSKALAKEQIRAYSDTVYLDLEETKKLRGKWTKSVFQNSAKLHLEIGMGKGTFITTLASRNPQNNYIGLEIKEERALSAAKKAEKLGLNNVRFICCNFKFLPEIFADNEIDQLYINFPDPWPKKRHLKRRMMYVDFLTLYRKLLTKGGSLQLKTDHAEFYQFSLESLLARDWKITQNVAGLAAAESSTNEAECFVETEFEQKWRERGKEIFFVEAYPNSEPL